MPMAKIIGIAPIVLLAWQSGAEVILEHLPIEDLIHNHLRNTDATIQIRNIKASASSCYALFDNGHSVGTTQRKSDKMDSDEYLIPNRGIVLSTAHSLNASQTTLQREDDITGDPDIDSQIVNGTVEVFDACFIQFEFSCPIDAGRYTTNVDFRYVFGSEEYDNGINHENTNANDRKEDGFTNNDAFGVFLNEQNIALLPDRYAADVAEDGRGILPVSIHNINSNAKSEIFMSSNPSHSEIKGGVYTTELRAVGRVFPGWNTIKFVVGDAGDRNLDSWVFIKAGSFSCTDLERDVDVEPPVTYPIEIDLIGINSTESVATESVATESAPTESAPTESAPTESENGDQEDGGVVMKANFVIPMSMALGVIVLLGLLALAMPLIGLSFYDKKQTRGCGRQSRRYGKAKKEVAKTVLAQKEPAKKEPETA